MADKKLELPKCEAGLREAVHVPMVAAQFYKGNKEVDFLLPGQSVRFEEDDMTYVQPCEAHMRHGIVNPFLTRPVEPSKSMRPTLDGRRLSNASY